MVSLKWSNRAAWLVYILWHFIFVILTLAVILPYLAIPVINDAVIGALPWSFAVYVTLIVAIPFISIVLVWRRFRYDVNKALSLFYAVELPLLLLLLLRVTLLRDSPLASQFIFFNIILGITAYFYYLINPVTYQTLLARSVDLSLSSIIALVGLYLGLVLGIYFLPLFFSVVMEVGEEIVKISWKDFVELAKFIVFNPLVILFAVLFFSTMLFFLAVPLILIVMYLYHFTKRLSLFSSIHIAMVVSVVLLCEIAVLTYTYQQPQQAAFELTELLPDQAEEQRKLLANTELIREGLLNAYLGAYRYLSTTQSSQSVERSYSDLLGDNAMIANWAQASFNLLASPFLYQGDSFESEKLLAAKRYQAFFDTPIEKAEKHTLLDAVKSSWENEQNEAGLMNAASHHVLLLSQTISVKEQGEFATITINQILENQTFQAQEVLFHFSLPEDAVINGLWMSDDIEQPEKFTYVISPRGAAQSVYKSEVRRRIDPALLEKVGPQQYRLRAFPVPARQVDRQYTGNRYRDAIRAARVDPVSVQFSYVVARNNDSTWPLPQLLEKRNVFWSHETKRTHAVVDADQWLPLGIKVKNNVIEQQIHIGAVNGNVIKAIPRELLSNINPHRVSGSIAVIIDGSYSMNAEKKSLMQQVEWLKSSMLDYDLFHCQSSCSALEPHNLDSLMYFGNSQLRQQMTQWQASVGKQYAAVFVLSDAGSYELSEDKKTAMVSSPKQPLWLVHLGDQLPYAYEDSVIDAVNDSGGGIARSLVTAIERYQWSRQLGQTLSEGQLIAVSDQYYWYLTKQEAISGSGDTSPFQAMAAGRWIQNLARTQDKSDVETLDNIHSIAKQFGIASFYSSMLVLVEDRQRQLLKEAEAKADRFDREVETGQETLSTPNDPFDVPAVPEPHEWALLIIVTLFLLTAYYKRRRSELLPEYSY